MMLWLRNLANIKYNFTFLQTWTCCILHISRSPATIRQTRLQNIIIQFIFNDIWRLNIIPVIFLSKFFNGKITHLCVRGLGFLVFRTFLCFSRCWGVINVKGPKGLSICLAALVDFLIDLVGPWFQKGPIASGSSALGQLHSRDSFDFYSK